MRAYARSVQHSSTGATPPFHRPHLHLPRGKFFHLRCHSLIRGSLLVLGSLAAAVLLSDFPHNRATPLLIFPVIFAILGIADTTRCLQRRWSFYHAGVILLIYMDLMAVSMIIFFFLYPYLHWLSPTH
jgi:hypothetical protein